MTTAVIVLSVCNAVQLLVVCLLIRQHDRMMKAISKPYQQATDSINIYEDHTKHYSLYKSKGDK